MPDEKQPRTDGSMSLLVDMTAAAMDPAYGDHARRRRQEPAARPGRRVLLAAMLVLVGLFTGVAAAQVRDRAGSTNQVRRSLVNDVRGQTKATDQLAARADRLRAEVAGIRDRALGVDARGRSAASQVKALEVAAGDRAVRGPGLLVTLDDAANSGQDAVQRGGQAGDGRIYDRDLQDVANALWAAGAEAMSINGQRLTGQTAIRAAGEAILVDLRPLSPPYLVRAVGNPDAMEPAFADSATARRFSTWTSLYGIKFVAARAGRLDLPAASTPQLRRAVPGTTTRGTP